MHPSCASIGATSRPYGLVEGVHNNVCDFSANLQSPMLSLPLLQVQADPGLRVVGVGRQTEGRLHGLVTTLRLTEPPHPA